MKNRYDAVISDISGQDIKEHGDAPRKLIEKVIEWFAANDGIANITSPSKAWAKYKECNARINDSLAQEGYTQKEIKSITIPQFIKTMKSAISDREI